MKLTSTFSITLNLVFLISSSCCLSAQTLNTLTIESPSAIAGSYNVLGAKFGLRTTTEIYGNAVFGIDSDSFNSSGCSVLSNTLEGSICFLDRGDCTLGKKVINAENAGAIAVVICNNTDEIPAVMEGGQDADNVSGYAGMISKADCELIRMELNNNELDINLTHTVETCNVVYTSNVVWGKEGQGAFTSGLGNWEATSTDGGPHTFAYSAFDFNQGYIQQQCLNIDSPSDCSGVIIADFDYFTTQGDSATFANLTFPAPQYSGHITSPSIDLSVIASPEVNFHQFYVPLNGQAYFQYSIDNGMTWSEEEIIETENFNPDSSLVSEEKTIKIPNAEYQSEVKLRFSYRNMDFYVWILDDIIIKGDQLGNSKENTIEELSFLVYPNPTAGVINMTLSEEIKNPCLITLHDIESKLIYTEYFTQGISNHKTIQLNNSPAGIYLLSIESKNKKLTKKILIE